MSIIVSKFGGSSTANAEMFLRIRDILDESESRRYIVLSAPGVCPGCHEKITNLLYQCYEEAASGHDIGQLIQVIQLRFSKIAHDLAIPDIDDLIEMEIRNAVMISPEHTASRGEYLCARLFSQWSGIPMLDASALVAFHQDGRLNFGRTIKQFSDMAHDHERLIIPGFYGARPDHSITTFTRNGSDVTGALAAAGVGADLYENWTDVEGFMSADPAIVPSARLNPQVSYRQMRALSRAGARVLHPDCLDPVSLADIPTRLRSTLQPENFGTLITNHFERTVPCVTGKPDYLLLRELDFCHHTRNLLTLAPHQIFSTTSGEEIALAKRDLHLADCKSFFPVACISIFGMTQEQENMSLEAVHPIAVIQAPDHFKVLVHPSDFDSSVRKLHGLLMN